MKKIYFAFLITLFAVPAISQWQPTNLTQQNYLAISGTTSHNGELYSIVFNGFAGELFRLNADQTSWSSVTLSGVSDIPSIIQSAGTDLYLTTNGLGYSMLYKSNDNGVSFVQDIEGLPQYLLGIELAYGLIYHDGKIVINLGSAGYWMKETSANTWNKIVTPTELNGGTDPLCFSGELMFAYDNSGQNILYSSDDMGQTWNTLSTNLPSYFEGHLIVADQISATLYMAGGKSDETEYGIYYSNDNGNTWVMADLSAYIGTNANGGLQLVKSMYAMNDEIYIALENDEANTTPDILHSSSGINNVEYYNGGLVTDPVGSVFGNKFVPHNNKMALALNVRDVYLSDISSSVNNEVNNMLQVRVFPNPAIDKIYIKSSEVLSNLVIRNLNGQVLIKSSLATINVSELPSGIYFVETFGVKGESISINKFIKY